MKLERLKELSGISESTIDDQFNVQLNKIQSAINKLDSIIATMLVPTSANKPVATQKMALRHAAEDLKKLFDKL